MTARITVVGGGLAGCEAALRLADAANAVSRATARDLLGPGAGDAMPVLYNPLPPAREASAEPA